MCPALEAQRLNHQSTREVPRELLSHVLSGFVSVTVSQVLVGFCGCGTEWGLDAECSLGHVKHLGADAADGENYHISKRVTEHSKYRPQALLLMKKGDPEK